MPDEQTPQQNEPPKSAPASGTAQTPSPGQPAQTAPLPSPLPSTSPAASLQLSAHKRNRKRWWLIGGAAALLLVVIGAVAAWAYYTNPDKVLGDALMHTLSAKSIDAKGTFEADDGNNNKLSVSFNAKASTKAAEVQAKSKVSYGTTTIDVNGDLVMVDQSLYFRFANAKQLAQLLLTEAEALQLYLPLIEKIDNQWIKLDDSSSDFGFSGNSKCQSAIENMKLSNADKAALKKLYEKYKFVTVTKQLGNEKAAGKDSLHFQLATNEKAGNDFFKEAVKIEQIKKVTKACDITAETDDTLISDGSHQVELWVERWSHKPTKLRVAGQDGAEKITVVLEGNLDAPVSVQKPANAKSFTQLLQEVQQSLLGRPAADDSALQQ